MLPLQEQHVICEENTQRIGERSEYLHKGVDLLLRDAVLVAIFVEFRCPVGEDAFLFDVETFVQSKLADDLGGVCACGRHGVVFVCAEMDCIKGGRGKTK